MPYKIIFKAKGKVQGIGYRWFVKETAEKCGVRGWVTNLSDGSVEGAAAGDEEKVTEFLSKIKGGHPLALIKELSLRSATEQELPEGVFTIKR